MRQLLIALFCLCTTLPAIANSSNAVVLLYHRFGEETYPSTNIPLALFEEQLEHLAKNDYQVWPLQRIVQHLQQNKPLPDRTIAITVDDAYLSVYSEAYPRLKARGWPFTVFVSTQAVDKRYKGFMDWQQMREMQQHGVSFANHGVSHSSFLQLSLDEVRKELETAQQRLQQELGDAPLLFAYPYGEYNTAVAELVKERGYIAFGQQSGALDIHSDRRALPRYPISGEFGQFPQFARKVASLALPVTTVTPWDPQTKNTQPTMTVTMAGQRRDYRNLSCYVSGQGKTEVQWLEDEPPRFTLRASQAFPAGRQRYNCTAPSPEAGRYYWYSHSWIIGE